MYLVTFKGGDILSFIYDILKFSRTQILCYIASFLWVLKTHNFISTATCLVTVYTKFHLTQDETILSDSLLFIGKIYVAFSCRFLCCHTQTGGVSLVFFCYWARKCTSFLRFFLVNRMYNMIFKDQRMKLD
jgi:hypothetical protein